MTVAELLQTKMRRFVLAAMMLFMAAEAGAGSSAIAAQQNNGTSAKISLTQTEKAWLETHKTIRVGISPVFPPLKFSDNGIIKGIEPDYLNLLTEYTGIKFEHVIADFSSMDAKVKSGELDMFITFYIPERLDFMAFTNQLMEFKQVIVTRNDSPFISGIGALSGKRVAAVKGVKLHDKLLEPYPDIVKVPVESMEEMFRAVSESRADALISRTIYSGYFAANYPNLKIAGILDLPPEPYMYAIRKDYPELVSIINKAISAIPKDRVDAIVQKWFNVRIEYQPNWIETLKWVLLIGGALTFVLGLALSANRRLAREIDRRVKAEQQLGEVNSFMNTVLKTLPVGIITYRSSGEAVSANIAAAQIVGATVEQLEKQNYKHIESWAHSGLLKHADLALLSGKEQRCDIHHISSFGVEADLDCIFVPFTFISEQYLMLMITDMTARIKIEKELSNKNNEMEHFIYSVSHDLRSPLVTINTFLGYLKNDIGKPEMLEQDIQFIQGASARMESLLNALLEMSRTSRPKSAPDFICFRELADQAIASLAGRISTLRIDVRIQDADIHLYGDRVRLGQIWQNLLENAIKFMGSQPGPIITLGAEQNDSSVVFFVCDNGSGIDPEDQDRMFNIFEKIDPGSEGVGMGLAMVKRIVEAYGGNIRVESAGAGKGACFRFTLPAALNQKQEMDDNNSINTDVIDK